MIPDRAGNIENWDIDKMTVILLRQFKRLMAQQRVDLTDSEMQQIGDDVAAQRALNDKALAIRSALGAIIAQSVDLLAGWNLTFEESLKTDMNDLDHLWQTTADFLSLANEKVNAEVRISAGASLAVLLGDWSFADYLMQAIDHDLTTHKSLDVDAAIARRALLHAANIDHKSDDWLKRIRATVADKN
jgi:hypothetical protein